MPDPPNEPDRPDELVDASREATTPSADGVGLFNRHLRYPNTYAWLLLFSALDVMLTWTIFHFGGSEVNPIAERVIDIWGLNGMIVYKFALITIFILICEVVGTLRDTTGRSLSRVSVLIAMLPVVWSMILLTRYAM